MWYDNNYRRIFLDMHISDDKPVYLSKFDPKEIISLFKEANAQTVVVKSRPHTGLAHHPTKFGRTHKALVDKDYVKEMIDLAHNEGLFVESYFSQIFDNWVYDNHPSWRMVNAEGKTSLDYCDYHNFSMFRRGRYGLICPNNEEYRAYVRGALQELVSTYDIDTLFLDMPFWPEICYCDSCKDKYFKAVGKEMPTTIDLESDEFKNFQKIREDWMCEFTSLSTKAIKDAKSYVTVEHNMSNISAPWQFSTTDRVANEACDYVSGDLYGGCLEQTFICKYYKNLTKIMPFVFITSRCDPGLSAHTTAKTYEELYLNTVITLVHGGAFAVCDGINPDGTLVKEAYTGIIKQTFTDSQKYEKYVNGEMEKDVAIFFPDNAKYDWKENGLDIASTIPFHDTFTNDFCKNPVNMAKILREKNILFDVYPASKIDKINEKVLTISDVVNLTDVEADAIIKYVLNGGSLYISGRVGNKKLLDLLEAKYIDTTKHNVTYMSPTEAGKEFMSNFSNETPLNVRHSQAIMQFSGEYTTLANLTLPYTPTATYEFSAIHSNPPGESTNSPAMVLKNVGKGKILWVAAPIESMVPYFTREVVSNLIKYLAKDLIFTSDAPSFVEIVCWNKDGNKYLALLNEQDHSPIAPIHNINITLPYKIQSAQIKESSDILKVDIKEDKTILTVEKLELLQLIEIKL